MGTSFDIWKVTLRWVNEQSVTLHSTHSRTFQRQALWQWRICVSTVRCCIQHYTDCMLFDTLVCTINICSASDSAFADIVRFYKFHLLTLPLLVSFTFSTYLNTKLWTPVNAHTDLACVISTPSRHQTMWYRNRQTCGRCCCYYKDRSVSQCSSQWQAQRLQKRLEIFPFARQLDGASECSGNVAPYRPDWLIDRLIDYEWRCIQSLVSLHLRAAAAVTSSPHFRHTPQEMSTPYIVIQLMDTKPRLPWRHCIRRRPFITKLMTHAGAETQPRWRPSAPVSFFRNIPFRAALFTAFVLFSVSCCGLIKKDWLVDDWLMQPDVRRMMRYDVQHDGRHSQIGQ